MRVCDDSFTDPTMGVLSRSVKNKVKNELEMDMLVTNWKRFSLTILTITVIRSQCWDSWWEELVVVVAKTDTLTFSGHSTTLPL